MKIVVLDGFPLNPGDNPWDPVHKLGEVTIYPRTPPEKIAARAAEAEIVVTNKCPLTAETFSRLPKLRFVTITATGYNIVDGEEARKRGIPVSNVPGYSSDAVAQHTFALLLEMTNRAGEHDRAVKTGRWSTSPDFCFWTTPLVEVSGKTIGIVGYGDIGRRVARIALSFGMRVLAYTRTPKEAPDTETFGWASDLDELFSAADIVSLHCPQTDETAGMVNARRLRLMKPGAFLINTARGGLVVDEDLAEALRNGELAGAGVDVVSREPIQESNPLLTAPNCWITPHLAWGTIEARRRLMQLTAANIAAFREGEPINVVNGEFPKGID